MKHYNIQNYIRYKKDLEASTARLKAKRYDEHSRNELVIRFMPLVENIARKFCYNATSFWCYVYKRYNTRR